MTVTKRSSITTSRGRIASSASCPTMKTGSESIGDAVEIDGMGTGGAVGDFDGDGMLELVVAHGESGPMQPLSLFKCNWGVSNHYLRILPKTLHGAPARGARVDLVAGGRNQMRIIDAGSGYLCQMEPVAHFGLGQLTKAEKVK